MAKPDIHPDYRQITITCSTCHTTMNTGSTLAGDVKVDTCSSCHPFYTGSQAYDNVRGRVERFKNKVAQKSVLAKQQASDSKKQKDLNAVKAKKTEAQATKGDK